MAKLTLENETYYLIPAKLYNEHVKARNRGELLFNSDKDLAHYNYLRGRFEGAIKAIDGGEIQKVFDIYEEWRQEKLAAKPTEKEN